MLYICRRLRCSRQSAAGQPATQHSMATPANSNSIFAADSDNFQWSRSCAVLCLSSSISRFSPTLAASGSCQNRSLCARQNSRFGNKTKLSMNSDFGSPSGRPMGAQSAPSTLVLQLSDCTKSPVTADHSCASHGTFLESTKNSCSKCALPFEAGIRVLGVPVFASAAPLWQQHLRRQLRHVSEKHLRRRRKHFQS